METATGLYYVEQHSPSMRFAYRVRRPIFSGRTRFQKVDIVELEVFGKTVFLDEKIQSAAVDEYIYHESLVHPALVAHPAPRRVFVAGGGEGATLREILRHNTVERAVMVDIDGEFVDLCRVHLPEWHQGAFDDPRVEVIHDDARKYLFDTEEVYDVVISDLTEPLEEGPSQLLFTREFYAGVQERLAPDGMLVVQSASADPVYADFVASIARTLEELFPVVRVYWAFVFSFQMPWSFVVASRRVDPALLVEKEVEVRLRERGVKGLRYYSPELHPAMFRLPAYLRDLLRNGRVLTDRNPYVYPD